MYSRFFSSRSLPLGLLSPSSLPSYQTVSVLFTDMYGRNLGKRFDPMFFLDTCVPKNNDRFDLTLGHDHTTESISFTTDESSVKQIKLNQEISVHAESNSKYEHGTHACDYLLACNMGMNPIDNMKFANWERGFGDMKVVPDMNTLRHAEWQSNKDYSAAMVFSDLVDEKTGELVRVAPRSILKKQMEEAKKMAGYKILAASELEYYLYKTSFKDAADKGYAFKDMTSVSNHVEDYHMLQTAREEPFHIRARHALKHSGVPVETTKGEAGVGQHELNIKYSDILTTADRHQVYKQCLKEIADQMGWSITFMAKPYHEVTGSGCHIHLSLWKGDDNAFVGDQKLGPVSCSTEFRHFLGGWIKHAPDCMPFYAPTINSYKRFVSSSWAPTRLVWSYDNRTAGFRVVGKGKSLRIECRIPGADANPYLAFAASLASGLDGIKNKIEPPPIFNGNIYEARELPQIPLTLLRATEIFSESEFTKRAFGADVVDHYKTFYYNEISEYEKAVTDWERKRYFEQI